MISKRTPPAPIYGLLWLYDSKIVFFNYGVKVKTTTWVAHDTIPIHIHCILYIPHHIHVIGECRGTFSRAIKDA